MVKISSGAIDISPIRAKNKAIRTPFEDQLLKLAQCNEPKLLEEADFFLDSPCITHLPEGAKKQGEPPILFREYRLLVIDYYLSTRTPRLKAQISGDDIQTFIRVIAKHSTAVENVSDMLSQLEAYLLPKSKEFQSKGLIIFSLPWLSLYNARAADQKRLDEGMASILLPNGPLSAYATPILKALSEGRIDVGLMPSEIRTFNVGKYETDNDRILLSPALLKAPFADCTEEDAPTMGMEATGPHELFHANTDRLMKKNTVVQEEVEANLVGLKSLIVLKGQSYAHLCVDSWQKKFEAVIDESVDDPENTPERKVVIFYDQYFRKNSGKSFDGQITLGEISKLSHLELDVAQRELETGRVDKERRRYISRLYAARHLSDGVAYEMLRRAKYNEEQRTIMGNEEFLESLKGERETHPEGVSLMNLMPLDAQKNSHSQTNTKEMPLFSNLEAAQKVADIFFKIFYFEGETKAFSYLEEKILPVILGNAAINWFMKLRGSNDGIPRDRRKLR